MNGAKICPQLALLGLIAILAGCTARPPLAELEMEASKTGDWSAVEQREAREKARLEESGPPCPEHLIKFCVREGPRLTCTCVSPAGAEQR